MKQQLERWRQPLNGFLPELKQGFVFATVNMGTQSSLPPPAIARYAPIKVTGEAGKPLRWFGKPDTIGSSGDGRSRRTDSRSPTVI
jgi:hypothetical protein